MRLVKVKISAAILVILPFMQVSGPASPDRPKDKYKLVWSDEFNGKELDRTKWGYRTGVRLQSTQLPGNVSLRDGNLVIALRRDGKVGYTAGGVISRPTFHYGYYEARVKILAGRGWHSSFWMMRATEPGAGADAANIELDAMENRSTDLLSYTVNTHRWAPPHQSFGTKKINAGDMSKDFHVIGCDYAPDVIRYYLDGVLVSTLDYKGQPQGDVNVWLTSVGQAMGPNKDIDDKALPGEMLVDWVHVYAK